MRKGTQNIGEFVSAGHQKRRGKLLLVVVAVVALLLYGVLYGAHYLLFRSSLLQAATISVSGNRATAESDIRDLLQKVVLQGSRFGSILGFNDLLVWPARLTSADLAFLPGVADIRIDKSYRARIVEVRVTERQPFGVWCEHPKSAPTPMPAPTPSATPGATSTAPVEPAASEPLAESFPSRCYWFDSAGYLFQRAGTAEGSLIKIVHDYSGAKLGLGSYVMTGEALKNLMAIFDNLSHAGVAIKEVRVEDSELSEVHVTTYDGPVLLFSLRFAPPDTVQVLSTLRTSPQFKNYQYVDFRVENRVYYK